MLHKMKLLAILSTAILVVQNCEENKVVTPDTKTSDPVMNEKIEILNLVDPDSIPAIVNQRALDLAFEKRYSNIRLTQIESKASNKYHILFFADDLTELEAYVITIDRPKNVERYIHR